MPQLVAHSGLKPPMRPRTHTRKPELFCELGKRCLNASAQPHLYDAIEGQA